MANDADALIEIGDRSATLLLVARARRDRSVLIFLTCWLVGWFIGEVFMMDALLTGEGSSLLILLWGFCWSWAGVVCALRLLWMVGGREAVVIRSGVLTHRYEVFGLANTRYYNLSEIRHLWVATDSEGLRPWLLGSTFVGFYCGEKAVRLGRSMDETQRRMIANRIQSESNRLTTLKPTSGEDFQI